MASRAERSMSFGAVAADYDRLRPSAPPEAVSWLLPAAPNIVVDLGAGTGLLARAVAPMARHVIAIEPDRRMRAYLRQHSPGIEVLAGRAEHIPLPDASADAVLVASAWHWMERDKAAPEIARVLRDGGRFGVIWNSRDESASWLHSDTWFAAVADDATTGGHRGSSDRAAALAWLTSQAERPTTGEFANIETQTFRFSRTMSIPDIADMLTTYSGVITASDEVKAAGRARAIAALTEQFPGASTIELPMVCWCWRADRAAR